jgi:cyanophycinase-like exopeptidase
MQRLGPAALDAATWRRRAVVLNPEQLGALQQALPEAGQARQPRSALGRMLAALAGHHLRHTIEVDEEMTVEISETAIEIEG